MQEKQAAGIDTRAMLPILTAIFAAAVQFLPWFSLPKLKYTGADTAYTIWNFEKMIQTLQAGADDPRGIPMTLFSKGQISRLSWSADILCISAVVVTGFAIAAACLAYRKKKKAAGFVRVVFGGFAVQSMAIFAEIVWMNHLLNGQMGRSTDFFTLTIQSNIQATAYPWAVFVLSIVMGLFAGKLLDTKREEKGYELLARSQKPDKGLSRRTKVAAALILLAIPFTLFAGIFFLNDRNEDFIALCIIGLAMVPFCMIFEGRRPQAREIVVIAVMSALAVSARLAFFMLPQFKPSAAIIIITGIALGAEAGFFTGVLTGFVSNFFFGQGPWTPWQMFAFGIIGFLAGLIFARKRGRGKLFRLWTCIYGGVSVLFIYGGLMDTQSVFMSSPKFSKEVFLAYYISGFPFNLIHAACTVVFLFLLLEPILRKLERVRKKYGLAEP